MEDILGYRYHFDLAYPSPTLSILHETEHCEVLTPTTVGWAVSLTAASCYLFHGSTTCIDICKHGTVLHELRCHYRCAT